MDMHAPDASHEPEDCRLLEEIVSINIQSASLSIKSNVRMLQGCR